jgi:hypothetical protein
MIPNGELSDSTHSPDLQAKGIEGHYFAQKFFIFYSFYLQTKTYNNIRVNEAQSTPPRIKFKKYRPPHTSNSNSYFSYDVNDVNANII